MSDVLTDKEIEAALGFLRPGDVAPSAPCRKRGASATKRGRRCGRRGRTSTTTRILSPVWCFADDDGCCPLAGKHDDYCRRLRAACGIMEKAE